jgi:Skp family chaperone for outer membrane proteins
MKRCLMFLIPALLTACAGQSSSTSIATVDVTRISANWPKFINYQNQLSADSAALERANLPVAEKDRQAELLRKRYTEMQDEVTGDVRRASEQVAAEKHYKLVVTRDPVGYGGTDITSEVEKLLNITEPAPTMAP